MIRYRVAFASAVLVAFFASNAMAASSVGKMTASGSVQLNGVQLPVEGVPSWPLVLGDEIATTARPATIMLNDGSRVYVEKNSRVALRKGLAQKIQVLLVAGALPHKEELAWRGTVAWYFHLYRCRSMATPQILGARTSARRRGEPARYRCNPPP